VAAAEIDADAPDIADLDEFLSGYLANYAKSYTIRHERELKGVINLALDDGNDDIETRVDERVQHWQDNEPRQESQDQPFEAVNAIAVATYRAKDVRYLRWLASGESCDFCQSLSGKVVGIEQHFVMSGSALNVGGQSMKISRNRRHGPLHGGCDCVVVAA